MTFGGMAAVLVAMMAQLTPVTTIVKSPLTPLAVIHWSRLFTGTE